MNGFDIETILKVRKLTTLPIIASSGCGEADHAIRAIDAGANAIGVGALFHFTESTPNSLHQQLHSQGINLRRN
jgi:cyclase